MAKELGIGVRVRIGWGPDSQRRGPSPFGLCGVIDEGPLPSGAKLRFASGPAEYTNEVVWIVLFDDGKASAIAPRYLFPIDDDTETQTKELTECL